MLKVFNAGDVNKIFSTSKADEEITLFKSAGLAVQNLATASIVVNEGNKLNLEQEINH